MQQSHSDDPLRRPQSASPFNSLCVRRFRAFRDETLLQLATLMIVIGRHGGGKSILTHLPLLLSRSLDGQAEAPLNLDAGGISSSTRVLLRPMRTPASIIFTKEEQSTRWQVGRMHDASSTRSISRMLHQPLQKQSSASLHFTPSKLRSAAAHPRSDKSSAKPGQRRFSMHAHVA